MIAITTTTDITERASTMANSKTEQEFRTFADFYPYYLQEHSNLTCRRLHFIGTAIVIALMVTIAATGNLKLLIALPLAGYGFAWTGHFFFEKNRPATFKYPLYSLWADFVMFKDILVGKIER